MIKGLEGFKEWFAGYEDCYTIIGGTACDIIMSEAGQDFRATKDFDIVLIAEALTREFCARLHEYIVRGGYEHLNRSSGKPEFYRFTKPNNPYFPAMIELFSRKTDFPILPEESQIIPISVDESIISLSAILLDDSYYSLLVKGRRVIDGVPILPASCLIPFKMKAWLDLTRRKEEGEQIDKKDIDKHRKDVFRLVELLHPNEVVQVDETVLQDIESFLQIFEKEEIDLKHLGVAMDEKELFKRLRHGYGLGR